MHDLLIQNALIYDGTGAKPYTGFVAVKGDKIAAVGAGAPVGVTAAKVVDAKGLSLSPGFIDVHIHGAGGHDTMDGTFEAINEISKTICKYGTTSFTPTTMTMSTDLFQ